jgi:hypothetical protein
MSSASVTGRKALVKVVVKALVEVLVEVLGEILARSIMGLAALQKRSPC